MKKALVLVCALVALAGCQTMNKWAYEGKCTKGDWEAIGKADGKTGSINIGTWNERCSQFGTTPNESAYMKGVTKGKVQRCAGQGTTAGKEGQKMTLPGNCSTAAETTAFKKNYSKGIAGFCTAKLGQAHGIAGSPKNPTCESNKTYKSSYAKGNKSYCTTRHATAMGVKSAKYKWSMCHVQLQKNLKTAYYSGKKKNDIKQEIAQLEKEVKTLEPKVYDSKIPADARAHYKEILSTKRNQIKTLEKSLYKM